MPPFCMQARVRQYSADQFKLLKDWIVSVPTSIGQCSESVDKTHPHEYSGRTTETRSTVLKSYPGFTRSLTSPSFILCPEILEPRCPLSNLIYLILSKPIVECLLVHQIGRIIYVSQPCNMTDFVA
jgi:hypothetical protein